MKVRNLLPVVVVGGLIISSCTIRKSSDGGDRIGVAPAPTGVVPAPVEMGPVPTPQYPVPIAQPGETSCYKGDPLICQIENLIIQKTNFKRGSRRPLTGNAHLSFISRQWSDTQARRRSIGHDGFPNQRSRAFVAEFKSTEGLDLSAENVAMSGGATSSAEGIAQMFVDMWWGSPGHRANMIGNYEFIGVGVSQIGGAWYGTQIFAVTQ